MDDGGVDGAKAAETSTPRGDERATSGDSEASTADVVGPHGCATRISGTGPFAVHLTGEAVCPNGCAATVAADLYFPKGRVAGAPVVLDLPSTDRSVGRATLDGSLAVGSIGASTVCGYSVKGALVGPDDGLHADLELNLDWTGSDALHLVKATAVMCPSGSPPDPALTNLGGTTIVPGDTIELVPTTPVDEATLGAATVAEAPGATASIRAGSGYGELRLTVAAAQGRVFSPGSLSVDLRKITDVLGRAYSATVYAVDVLKPSGTIADAAPDGGVPESAIAASGTVVVANGKTRISGQGPGFAAVIGLGAGTGSTKAHVVHQFVCLRGSSTGTVSVVSSDGSFAAVAGSCGAVPDDVVVTLPGPGPHYLVVRDLQARGMMCVNPPPPVADEWELTSVTLEP